MVKIESDAVLATVNGAPVRLADLLPLPSRAEADRPVLSRERFESLLDRAITREVVVQAARAKGLELTTAQREQLARFKGRVSAVAANTFDTLQHQSANDAFAEREAVASLLQSSLAEQAGVTGRDITPAHVLAHYQQNSSAYGVLPADPVARDRAWASIEQEIRLKLAKSAAEANETGMAQFLDQLRRDARVVTSQP
jgi:hypothetical protein